MALTHAITLRTARLTLDAHRNEDLPCLAAMWADPDVVRHVCPPSNAPASAARLARYQSMWPRQGFGYWAVRETSSGIFLGDLGFADFARDITPSIAGLPEAGWVFTRAAWGHGFATEALTAALGWLDRQASIAQSDCLIAPDNLASLRLARSLGYDGPERVAFKGEDTLLLRRPRA